MVGTNYGDRDPEPKQNYLLAIQELWDLNYTVLNFPKRPESIFIFIGDGSGIIDASSRAANEGISAHIFVKNKL